MCGIAGMMTKDDAPADSAVLAAMADAMRHRGPDGQGQHLARNIGLVQTRLAIIDLETGDQPMFGPDRLVLIANAEIYNYVELRAALGDVFATRSDCEPVLHLYRRYGLDFTEHLRGMYAVAIYDPDERQLVLSRDPFGIKPLYYTATDDALFFASEPHVFFDAGVLDPVVDEGVRAELLQLQYSTGNDTIFRGVHRVGPGETLVIRDGRIVERRRRAALPSEGAAQWTADDAEERMVTALRGSVEVHQRSDVPYGMFLSGGIDSSAVLALMAELNDTPVLAFTAGFAGTAVADETMRARAVAEELGARSVEVQFGEDDFWRLLPKIAAAMDDPAADYAILPTYKLAECAKDEGIKVVLCGEGGDELFGGYGRYRSAMRPVWRGGRRMRSQGIFDGMRVLTEPVSGWRDGLTAAEVVESDGDRSRLQAAQATDCRDWLPNDLLMKLDRCLMTHGVEGRTPFLDKDVAEVAFRLPDKLKVRSGRGKWLLRRWISGQVRAVDAFGKKRGFTVPVGEWIRSRGRDAGDLVAQHPGIAALCDPGEVRALFQSSGKRASFAAWTLLFYALWHTRHVLRQPVDEDVFETLALR